MRINDTKINIVEITAWLTFGAFISGAFFSVGQSIILGGSYLSSFSYNDFIRNALFSIFPLIVVVVLTMMCEIWLFTPVKNYIESVSRRKSQSFLDKLVLFIRPIGYLIAPYSIIFSFTMTEILNKSPWFWLTIPGSIIISLILLICSRKAVKRSQINKNPVALKPFDDYFFSPIGLSIFISSILILNSILGYWFIKGQSYYVQNSSYTLTGTENSIKSHYVTSNTKMLVFAENGSFVIIPRSQIKKFEKTNTFLKK